jgi:WD40 repeat protein/DNA-binding SARP family transcriptional activator
MGIAVLGPIRVDDQVNRLSPRDRVVLSALVVKAGEPISTEALADALWGEALPASWATVVHGCVVRLRKRLGVAAIESGPSGYRLTLSDEELDHRLFERLLERGREALAGGDPERSSYLLQEALELWRGRVLADLEEWEPGRVEAARLEGLRMDAEELRVEAETRAGHAQAVLEQARALVAQAPFRERRWALLATALHQSGRQAEALGSLKRARAMLVNELGLDPGRELVELEQLLLRQDPSLAPSVGREVSGVCPYRGLLAYDAEDADSFFGREDDVAACLRRLRDLGVLAVIGPSGIGKSSLVRAGVVASLARGGTPVLVTTPGVHPMDSLAALKPRGRQTLVVDQAEEAVTVCSDPAERERYFGALATHVGAGGALVLSLRADHLGDLAPYPEIARVLEAGLYLLGPMSEPDLRAAIEGPARRAGLRLEPGLVDLLVREVEGEPAALPMLSHVLRETWERREGPTLTVAGYRATGGIRYAVSQSAESLYDAMDTPQRSRLRSLLLRLVMPTEDGDPVRARVPRARLATDDAHQRLVELLVDARLVSIDGDTLQIAHEALVRVWPRLRGWLDDDVDGQRLFRHLAGAADAWEAMGRPDSELYRGARLGRTLEWRDRATPDLNDNESAFVAASVALSETELHAAETRIARERRVNRRLRSALAGVGVLLVLALVAGVVAVQTADQAQRNQTRAESSAVLADARRASAQAPLHENVATGLLLAVAALRVDTSPQSWENLGAVLTRAGPLAGVRDLGEAVGRPGTASIADSAASADGALVAASLAAEGVRLFDAGTLAPVEFADDTPTSVIAFAPDGKQLASAVSQHIYCCEPRIHPMPVQLYDMPSGAPSERQLGGMPQGGSVEFSLDFSGDGKRLAAVVQHYEGHLEWSRLGHAMVWDLADPSEPVFRAAIPKDAVASLSPDGGRLYAAVPGERPLRAYDVESGELIRWAENARVAQTGAVVETSPDGSTLAVASGDRIFRYATATLRPRGPALRGHTGTVADISYSHDGRLMVSASADRSAIVWDAASGDRLHRFVGHRAGVSDASFGADDQSVYTTGGEGLLLAWNVKGLSRLLTPGEATTEAEEEVYSLSLPAPNGSKVARLRSGRLWFENPRTGRRTTSPQPNGDEYFLWSPDSRWLLSSSFDGSLRLWDAESGGLVARGTRNYEGDLVAAFSPDSDKVYLQGARSVLVTLDRASLRPAYENSSSVDFGGISALLPHPRDGSVIVLKGNGAYLRVRPETGEKLQVASRGLLAIEDQVGALSPDGSLMAAPDANHNVRLLDLETLEWIGADSHTLVGEDLSYAPDGRQFASLQPERIRLWDGRTGEYQASLPVPSLTAHLTISYLPDSTGLLVAATDGRTWTVDTRTDKWVERACKIAGRNLTRAEWKQFFPKVPYEVTCSQWPAGT